MRCVVVLLSTVILLLVEGKHDGDVQKDHVSSDQSEKDREKDLYEILFMKKRREQLEGVHLLQQMSDKRKQAETVASLFERMEKVLTKAKLTIAGRPFLSFSTVDAEMRDAIALVLENAAFFAEFALRLPSITGRYLEKHLELRLLIEWAFELSNDIDVNDTSTGQLIDLASQQLEIIPRREDFHNPYDIKQRTKEEIEREADEVSRRLAMAKKKADKSKANNKTPKISKGELYMMAIFLC